jgi:cellulose synthase/poly-beta-1,6-N-acetylglucosamine synthase-like glycosyltransferase
LKLSLVTTIRPTVLPRLRAHTFREKSQFTYIKVTEQRAGLKGKANVLAQIAHQAKGRYFIYCDADIAVQPGWASEMLAHFRPETGVVVGVTRMKHTHLLADLLSMEWLFALSAARFFRW